MFMPRHEHSLALALIDSDRHPYASKKPCQQNASMGSIWPMVKADQIRSRNVSGISCVTPLRFIVRRKVVPGGSLRSALRRSYSFIYVTGLPSTAVMTSSGRRPVSAAGVPLLTSTILKPFAAALIHMPERSKVSRSSTLPSVGFKYIS